jgi:hypothetical protein
MTCDEIRVRDLLSGVALVTPFALNPFKSGHCCLLIPAMSANDAPASKPAGNSPVAAEGPEGILTRT